MNKNSKVAKYLEARKAASAVKPKSHNFKTGTYATVDQDNGHAVIVTTNEQSVSIPPADAIAVAIYLIEMYGNPEAAEHVEFYRKQGYWE